MFRLRWPADPGGVFARCFSAYVFPPFENGLASVQISVGWLQVVQAIMVAAVVIVPDELSDALFELAWLVIFLQ
jgi:hypothetical protein